MRGFRCGRWNRRCYRDTLSERSRSFKARRGIDSGLHLRRLDFLRYGSDVQLGRRNTAPAEQSRQEPDTPLAHPLQKRRFFRGAKVDNAKSIAIRVLFCFMRAPCAHHCCSCLRRESSRHGVTGNYGLPAKPAPSCTCVSPEYQACSGSGWRDP